MTHRLGVGDLGDLRELGRLGELGGSSGDTSFDIQTPSAQPFGQEGSTGQGPTIFGDPNAIEALIPSGGLALFNKDLRNLFGRLMFQLLEQAGSQAGLNIGGGAQGPDPFSTPQPAGNTGQDPFAGLRALASLFGGMK